jgi:hypothetical protein
MASGVKKAQDVRGELVPKRMDPFRADSILDFYHIDDRVHGLQEGRHFHGYYYNFCLIVRQ